MLQTAGKKSAAVAHLSPGMAWRNFCRQPRPQDARGKYKGRIQTVLSPKCHFCGHKFERDVRLNNGLLFQDDSIALLAATAFVICSEVAPSLTQRAMDIRDKHTRLLSSFGKCHRAYNATKVFTQVKIDNLGKLKPIIIVRFSAKWLLSNTHPTWI